MAIVTFSPQVAMIADVLAYAFGQETALKIPIRGNDSSWEYSGGGSREGKQGHISSACEEVTQNLQQMAAAASSVNPAACGETRRSTTLLIDDDGDNVAHALENRACVISRAREMRRKMTRRRHRPPPPLAHGTAEVRAVLFKPAQPEAVIEELFGLE